MGSLEAGPGPTVGNKHRVWDAVPERTNEERERVKWAREGQR